MMKTNFIRRSYLNSIAKSALLSFAIIFFQFSESIAQCSLACKSSVNISVAQVSTMAGGDCSIGLTADMILNGQETSCSGGVYSIKIDYPDGTSESGPVDATTGAYNWNSAFNYIHETVSISITDTNTGNTCWGHALIEDKLPPKIICLPVVYDTVSCCNENKLDVYPNSGSGTAAMTGSGITCVLECSAFEWVIVDQKVTLNNDCSFDRRFSKVIERRLVARDEWGLQSIDTLTQLLKVERINIDSLDEFGNPVNYICPLGSADPIAYSCETLPEETIIFEDVEVPAPSIKGGGLPYIIKEDGPDENTFRDTIPIFPLNAGDSLTTAVFQNCNVSARYVDRLLPSPGKCGGYTLLRTWTISEWACDGEIERKCTQKFELIDRDGPTLVEGVHDFEGTTNGYTCEGSVFVPAPNYQDGCSGIDHIDVTYPGGFKSNYSPNGEFIELPVGRDTVIFTAYDACHNETAQPDTVIVDVWDKTPPVVICDEHTVVSLADYGSAAVPAKNFDGGSYDDCGIMEVFARRMDHNCDCTIPEYSTFGYLGGYEGSHYYLSNRPFLRDIANRKAQAMGAHVFDFETVLDKDGLPVSEERNSVVELLPVGIGDVIMAPNNVAEGRYILEVPNLCDVFREVVEFCCDDTEDQMVVLRACDHQGNYNDCMFEVELQNKLEPKILHCPADIYVSCRVNFEANEPALSSIFGTLAGEPDVVGTYDFVGGFADKDMTLDSFMIVSIGTQPDTLCDGSPAAPYEIWDGQYWENCGGTDVQVEIDDKRNKCGLGKLYRTFTLSNGKEDDYCVQTIDVLPEKPFNFNSIVLPDSLSVMTCGEVEDFHPDVTGYPVIEEGACDLVGFNYTDQVFLFNDYEEDNVSCFKILRTWQFIDWCTFEGDTNQPYPMPPYVQVIKITDKDAPQILFTCDERSECTYDPNCESGYIELLKEAVDGCTGPDHLKWEADVYIDIKSETNTVDTSMAGIGHRAEASGHYPVGKHLVKWTFWDRCGNVTTCDQIFQIKNCKAAAPYCIDGIVVDLMPVDDDGDGIADSGMVELWASDFDLGSTHPCGYPVILSFSDDITDANRTFTCDYRTRIDVRIYSSVIIGEGAHADTIQSYCNTHLNIQDNNRVCDDRGPISEAALISGFIRTELNQNLGEAEVHLDGSELVPSMTNSEGQYAFPNMPLGGAYVVEPRKDDDHINGVSTLDLVMIQKHILGLQLLDSPYKMIAADVNKDQEVSASDLVELRKLILGNIDEYNFNESWRFVDRTYAFANENNPLGELFAEEYEIPTLSQDMGIDFTAVKVGDVNNSVVIADYLSTEVRSDNSLVLIGNPKIIGDEIRLAISAKEGQAISGMQFTMDFDNLGLDFVSVETGKLSINNQNLGLKNVKRGLLTLSWNKSELVKLNESEVLFTVVFKGSTKDLTDLITINSELTKSEAYTENNLITDVQFELAEGSSFVAGYDLRQNTPNPFKDATAITFSLPEAMNAQITIHDITGKIVRSYNDNYNRGINTLEISRSQIEVSGVLYYTLTTENYSATKRMVILD